MYNVTFTFVICLRSDALAFVCEKEEIYMKTNIDKTRAREKHKYDDVGNIPEFPFHKARECPFKSYIVEIYLVLFENAEKFLLSC